VKSFFLVTILLGVILVAIGPVSRCAADVGDGVTATGRATLSLTPDRIRVRVRISSTNRDVAQAVSDLARHRDAIQHALADLTPVDGTLSAGSTHAGAGTRSNQDTLETLLMATGAVPGRSPAATEPSPDFTCTIQADWDLAAHGSDEAVVNAATLADRLRAAIAHAGQPTTQPATTTTTSTAPAAETSEIIVEPEFQYVHVLTDAERRKLLSMATDRATRDARALADSAGQQIGTVRRLSAASAGKRMSDDSEPIGDYLKAALAEPDTANSDPAEAIGSDPGEVSFTVEVTATFVLMVK
jgi:uncharacterized protein YggE